MRIDFQQIWKRLEVKNALKTALAAVLSFYLGLVLNQWVPRPDYLTGSLWSALAAIVVLQANVGATYKAIFNRFLGVLIGSGLGALFAVLFGASGFVLGCAILVTMLFCSLLKLQESYRIASLSVAVIIIPWSMHPQLSPWLFAFFRFLDTCLGLLVAAAVAYSIWPFQAVTKMRLNIVNILSLIRQFYQHIFILTGQVERREKAIQSLISEINPLFTQAKLALDESRLELFFKAPFIPLWENLIRDLERIFEGIISLKNVFDFDVENMFDEEFKQQIDQTIELIDSGLKEIAKKINLEASDFHSEEFELSNHRLDFQMLRFRQIHRTKEYSLSLVEKYFVLLHGLRSLNEELIQLNALTNTLQAENNGTG